MSRYIVSVDGDVNQAWSIHDGLNEAVSHAELAWKATGVDYMVYEQGEDGTLTVAFNPNPPIVSIDPLDPPELANDAD